jgi:hypothetical protein
VHKILEPESNDEIAIRLSPPSTGGTEENDKNLLRVGLQSLLLIFE